MNELYWYRWTLIGTHGTLCDQMCQKGTVGGFYIHSYSCVQMGIMVLEGLIFLMDLTGTIELSSG